ncbi:hypothetical protein F5X96DRAFT_673921 [Biscogniauxia mediterranea]|nr:hypothetical protein F5X96DRAFT_673921 [Biscogniauxia mediterranea]
MEKGFSRNQLGDQGLTQVHTGLGILLGTGHLDKATYDQILAILNDKVPKNLPGRDQEIKLPRMGKASSSSSLPQGIESGIGRLTLANTQQGPQAAATRQGSTAPGARHGQNIICPWWATDGYQCREPLGKCPFLHRDTPGAIKEPLICSFYTDGNRCKKTAEECRFAHYRAQHSQVAPTPTAISRSRQN